MSDVETNPADQPNDQSRRADVARATLAKRITQLMADGGANQVEVGRAIGVAGSQISRYTKVAGEPKLAQLLKPAHFFDVSVDYLIDPGVSSMGLNTDERMVLKAFRIAHDRTGLDGIEAVMMLGAAAGYGPDKTTP